MKNCCREIWAKRTKKYSEGYLSYMVSITYLRYPRSRLRDGIN